METTTSTTSTNSTTVSLPLITPKLVGDMYSRQLTDSHLPGRLVSFLQPWQRRRFGLVNGCFAWQRRPLSRQTPVETSLGAWPPADLGKDNSQPSLTTVEGHNPATTSTGSLHLLMRSCTGRRKQGTMGPKTKRSYSHQSLSSLPTLYAIDAGCVGSGNRVSENSMQKHKRKKAFGDRATGHMEKSLSGNDLAVGLRLAKGHHVSTRVKTASITTHKSPEKHHPSDSVLDALWDCISVAQIDRVRSIYRQTKDGQSLPLGFEVYTKSLNHSQKPNYPSWILFPVVSKMLYSGNYNSFSRRRHSVSRESLPLIATWQHNRIALNAADLQPIADQVMTWIRCLQLAIVQYSRKTSVTQVKQ